MKSKIINDTMIENNSKKEIRSTILCVDDEKMMLGILFEQLTEWFGQNYRIEKALSGEEALDIVDQCLKEGEPISIIITDYMMPIMKGDELLIEIRKRDPKIKNIMLTGYTSVSGIITAINQAGLYRFIPKPWDAKDLMLTILEAIKSYEQDKKMRDLAKGFESLYRKCEDGTRHAVDALVSTIQAVDPTLARHSMRVRQYSIWLAKKLELDDNICRNLKYVAVLHEIGILGHPYENKESDEMHLQQISDAKKIISHLIEADMILKGIQYQFEKYDGTGLHKLKGDQIPEESRVLAIAHYYDLIGTNGSNGTNENVSVDKVVDLLEKRKGTLFDPQYVDEFIKILQPVR